jgi:DNA-binding transcriptional regulator YhcF (GntR family)
MQRNHDNLYQRNSDMLANDITDIEEKTDRITPDQQNLETEGPIKTKNLQTILVSSPKKTTRSLDKKNNVYRKELKIPNDITDIFEKTDQIIPDQQNLETEGAIKTNKSQRILVSSPKKTTRSLDKKNNVYRKELKIPNDITDIFEKTDQIIPDQQNLETEGAIKTNKSQRILVSSYKKTSRSLDKKNDFDEKDLKMTKRSRTAYEKKSVAVKKVMIFPLRNINKSNNNISGSTTPSEENSFEISYESCDPKYSALQNLEGVINPRLAKTAEGNLEPFCTRYKNSSMKYSKGINIGQEITNSVNSHFIIDHEDKTENIIDDQTQDIPKDPFQLKPASRQKILRMAILPKVFSKIDCKTKIISNNVFNFPESIPKTYISTIESNYVDLVVVQSMSILVKTHDLGLPEIVSKVYLPKFIDNLLERPKYDLKSNINNNERKIDSHSFREIELPIDKVNKTQLKKTDEEICKRGWKLSNKNSEQTPQFISAYGKRDPSKISTVLNKKVDRQCLPGHRLRIWHSTRPDSSQKKSENINITLVRVERSGQMDVDVARLLVRYILLIV